MFNATVKMGADGTDDDVTVGICSDSKTDCCERKLNKALTDNWKKNKVRLINSCNMGFGLVQSLNPISGGELEGIRFWHMSQG